MPDDTDDGRSAAPNVLTIHGRTYLLADLNRGAVHVVAEASPDEPAESIVEPELAEMLNPAFDPAVLTAKIWSQRTLCGQEGWVMSPTEAGSAVAVPWAETPAFAPTCRTCLRLLDRQFSQPEADDRLVWNVIRCIDELEQWGSFMIQGVPGDQMELLRRRVRAEARKRKWKFQSAAREDTLWGMSENSLLPERREFVERDSRIRMRGVAEGEDSLPEPSWRLRWS